MSGKKTNLAASLGMVLAVLGTCAGAAQDIAPLLDQIIVGAHRSDANKARDKYRHPKETLLFFGLKPDMTVVEITPGRGWYTEIIAPALRKEGKYFAAVSAVTEKTPDFLKQNDADFRAMLVAAPDLYGHAKLSVLAPGSETTGARGAPASASRNWRHNSARSRCSAAASAHAQVQLAATSAPVRIRLAHTPNHLGVLFINISFSCI